MSDYKGRHNRDEPDRHATANPAPPSGRPSKKQRNRPRHREKITDWADAAEREQDHRDSQRKPGHAKMSSKPSVPAPQPGKYPIVFDTMTGKATHDTTFSVDVGKVVKNQRQVLDAVQFTPGWNKYAAELSESRNAAAVLDFEANFVAAGILTTAQNIVKTFKEHNRDIMGMSNIDKANIVHLVAAREISAQYGIIPDPHTGQMFLPLDVKGTCDRLTRAAHQMRTNNGASIRAKSLMAESRAWAPISGDDVNFRNTCRVALQTWLDIHNLSFILVEDTLPLFTGEDPPWWPLIAEAARPQIGWLFINMTEATQANWVTALNGVKANFWNGQRIGRPLNQAGQPVNWVAADLGFETNRKAQFGTIVDAWAAKASPLASVFHTAGNTECSAMGSLTQFSTVEIADSITYYVNATTNTKTEASLAACFPPSSFLLRSRTPEFAKVVADVQLREVKTEWVSLSIRK